MQQYERIEKLLRDGMHEGNMHVCLRDIGSLAGGLKAGGGLTNHDLSSLEALAVSLAKDKQEATQKWREAVEYGRRSPIKPDSPDDYGHFGFDDRVSIGRPRAQAPKPVVDANWIESDDVPAPAGDWKPGDMVRYLKAMFEPDECVGIVTQVYEEGDKLRPGSKGHYDLTCAHLCEHLSTIGDVDLVIENTIGTPHPKAGVWVRINPLDGKGVKDINVTAFRHTLIEADDQDLGKQLALIRELELPCTAIVHSGGKSIHALVRVDAPDLDTYRARVDRLYQVCQDSGLKVDQANRNPSRLSRLPGVARGGRPQYLIDLKCGKASWDEWEKHIEEVQDDLPDMVQLDSVILDLPPLNPVYIEGIMREGHKMRLTGQSKGGKSFAMIELAAATAEGKEWLGLKCKQGPVLYINFEFYPAECYERFDTVYKALGWRPETASSIVIWNLRGKTRPLFKLAPLLIRRAKEQHFKAIIFDPLYKCNWGDENDAGDMSLFCNELDRVSYELGCCVIDAHHHSKGAQGQKKAMDRGSGSGVFSRDPDAILDMIELDLTTKRRDALENKLVHDALWSLATSNRFDLAEIPPDDQNQTDAFLIAFQTRWPAFATEAADLVQTAQKRSRSMSGWRIEATLRGFPEPDPIRIWFEYPRHFRDPWDLLTDAKAAGEEPPWVEQQRLKEERKEAAKAARMEELDAAIKAAGGLGTATITKVCDVIGMSDDAVRERIRKAGIYRVQRGLILSKSEDSDEE